MPYESMTYAFNCRTREALAAGSPVTLQTWNHMVHVWHLFNPELTEARQGFDEIAKFLESHAPRH